MSYRPLSISVEKIHVPEDYIRPLDEAEAQRLARLMQMEGQKTPIAVYSSPSRNGGRTPYTLIYGRRRLWAAIYLEWREISVILRKQDETDTLALTDNLSSPSLDALEVAEHLAEYRARWEKRFGTIKRGGARLSKRQNVGKSDAGNFGEITNFYNTIEQDFGINERRAQRLLKIARIHPDLRNAIRGTVNAKEYRQLARLTKYNQAEQVGIAAALKIEPDLDAVLRIADPVTGREAVGRMETGDWREQQFVDAWEGMPRDRRAAALEKIGAVAKPLDPWPTEFPLPPPLPATGNKSPLWEMMRDPYRTLYVAPTYAEILAAQNEQKKEEELEARRLTLALFEKVNAQEKANRPEHDLVVVKGKAAKARKTKRGRPAYTPEMKRQKAFQKWFIPELATNLLEREEVGITHWAVKYCRKLNAKEQYWVACHLGNGHRVDDIPWKVERCREDEANEEA